MLGRRRSSPAASHFDSYSNLNGRYPVGGAPTNLFILNKEGHGYFPRFRKDPHGQELCPILCPDGILAAKMPGLCKGGDNVGNVSGFGWLVFLRGGGKDKSDSNTDSELSIANKKFIHYNDDVYLPWLRELRKKLGWVEGQPVQESLKAVSWCDGDIGQLQTMLFES